MTAQIRFGGISLDSADPVVAAAFYRDLLGLTPIWETEDFVALRSAAVLLTLQRVADHRPPDWPEVEVPKQMHLDLAVDDLDAAEARAIELGATRADHQPAPDSWRVLMDPDGHPFCLTTLIPNA